MPDFVWKSGDTGPALTDHLRFGGGTPIPAEGASVELRLRSLASADIATTTGTAVFTSAEGDVEFVPSATDTSLAVGNYIAEWLVTFESGQAQTFPTDGYLWGRIEPNAASAPRLMVSLPDVKEHLGIPHQDRTRDAKLIGYIQTITPMIEAQIGPVIPRTFEEWFDGGSNVHDVIRQPSSGFGTTPVFRVLAASEYRGPIEYPLALVASPAFGSIYSLMVNYDLGTVTRRTAGGRTLAFMPGRDSVHILYEAGQATTPPNVEFAAKECVRMIWEWTRQVGRGSQAPADAQEVGAVLSMELSRMIRTLLHPTRRFPAFA